MINLQLIKNNISQILALMEKNLKVRLRYKITIFYAFISPLINIIMPLIIMNKFFEFNAEFGPWNAQNFLIYQLLAYNIILLQGILSEFPSELMREKYWQTLSALLIAPFNRFNLLLAIFLSRMVLISGPFIIFLVWCYIYYPVSFLTILFALSIFLLIALIFSGMGLLLGVFAISRESLWISLSFLVHLVFWTSCLSFPFQIFPSFLQIFINLNPFYYIFDFLRLAWIEDNVLFTISSHPLNFIILVISGISLPFIGVYSFNKVYRKWGIVGY